MPDDSSLKYRALTEISEAFLGSRDCNALFRSLWNSLSALIRFDHLLLTLMDEHNRSLRRNYRLQPGLAARTGASPIRRAHRFLGSDSRRNRHRQRVGRARRASAQPPQPRHLRQAHLLGDPAGLLEIEMFGHEKGAFTGALSQRLGRVELAHKGTLFLDEVADLPLELQPKLLRVLQDGQFERLGSSRTMTSEFHLIGATHRDLRALAMDQEFRMDLYYRLNIFPITVPPLRERRKDIPLLARFFVQDFADRMRKPIDAIPDEAMEALVTYPWPGNIRELRNVIERSVILSPGSRLEVPKGRSKPAAQRTIRGRPHDRCRTPPHLGGPECVKLGSWWTKRGCHVARIKTEHPPI